MNPNLKNYRTFNNIFNSLILPQIEATATKNGISGLTISNMKSSISNRKNEICLYFEGTEIFPEPQAAALICNELREKMKIHNSIFEVTAVRTASWSIKLTVTLSEDVSKI